MSGNNHRQNGDNEDSLFSREKLFHEENTANTGSSVSGLFNVPTGLPGKQGSQDSYKSSVDKAALEWHSHASERRSSRSGLSGSGSGTFSFGGDSDNSDEICDLPTCRPTLCWSQDSLKKSEFLIPVADLTLAEININPDIDCFDNTVGEFRQGNREEAVTRVFVEQRTSFLLRGISNVLNEHGATDALVEEACKQITAFLNQSPVTEELWVKRVKYLLSFPMSRYLRNEDPPKADIPFAFTGRFKRWFKNRLIAFNRKNSHLFYSWLQCKRCTLPASESMIQEAYNSHLQTLTKEDDGEDEVIDEIFREETFIFALNQVRYALNKEMNVLQAFKLDEGSHSPSTSACFEATRKQRGAFGSILDRVFDSKDRISSVISGSDFLCLRPLRTTRRAGSEIIEERIPCGIFEFLELRNHFSNVDIEDPISCTIQGIVEPLKIRVISKGEALPYYMMKPLQKSLHTIMRRMSCFRLIGEEISPTHLIDLQIKDPDHKYGLGWSSIDYKGATDNLSWKYSSRIMEYLLQDFSAWYRKLAFRVLGPHYLYYPTDGKKGGVMCRGIQKRGQLMGSILSFPILCLANLGAYCVSTKRFHQRLNLTKQARLDRVLVNGDDMLFASPRDVYYKHAEVAADIGLEMSLGKAYWHTQYANINSTSYHCSPYYYKKDSYCEMTNTPWQVSFLNTGLFEGVHKVMGDTQERSDYISSDEECIRDSLRRSMKSCKDPRIVCLINEVVQGALPGRQVDVLKKFMSRHRQEIALETTLLVRTKRQYRMIIRNLFLPISLGGMGVECPVDFKYKVTAEQIWLANQITKKRLSGQNQCKLSLAVPTQGPLVEDYSPPVVPWQKPFDDDDFFEEYTFEDHLNDFETSRFWSKSDIRKAMGLFTYSDQKRVYLKG